MRQNVFHPPMDGATEKQQRCGQVKMAAYLCLFIRFDHYPANHRTNQQGNIPVAVQQGNETCQEYIKRPPRKIALKYDIDVTARMKEV